MSRKNKRAPVKRATAKSSNKAQQGGQNITVTQQNLTHHSGPIPSPETLQQYDMVVSGAAERIIQMAENEQSHRHEMESLATTSHFEERAKGQWFGLLVALTGLSASALLGVVGQGDAAAIVGGSTLLGMVTIFVSGRILTPKSKDE